MKKTLKVFNNFFIFFNNLGINDYLKAWLTTPHSSFYQVFLDRTEEMWIIPDYGPVKNFDYRQLFYDSKLQRFEYRKVILKLMLRLLKCY